MDDKSDTLRDDATWILLSSFMIFSMQTGFGFLEAGCVSRKNEVNIMMKNTADVILGGFTYWVVGYGMTFGTDYGSTSFMGFGYYALEASRNISGSEYTSFIFQISFATTATTIVSGTMAERCNFTAYCIFSFANTFIYCIPARWIWGPTGWLASLGALDFAGSGVVHLLGGTSGFVAAWMLGPRLGRYDNGTEPLPLGSPANCILGMFVLWWGWLAFNSGSTLGVSGDKWIYASKAGATTMISSIGGGLVGLIYGFIKPNRKVEVLDIVNPVSGSLVGVTAASAYVRTFDAFIIGCLSGLLVIFVTPFADWLRVDDPVGATQVHGFCGCFGMLVVGLFAGDDESSLQLTKGQSGLLKGGGFYLLGVQALACVCIVIWSASTTFIVLWIINIFVPIRMSEEEELKGADVTEHLVRIRNPNTEMATKQYFDAMQNVAGNEQTTNDRQKSCQLLCCCMPSKTVNDPRKDYVQKVISVENQNYIDVSPSNDSVPQFIKVASIDKKDTNENLENTKALQQQIVISETESNNLNNKNDEV